MSRASAGLALLLLSLAACGEEASCPTKAIEVVELDGGPVAGNDFECTGATATEMCEAAPVAVRRRASSCGGDVQVFLRNARDIPSCVVFDIDDGDGARSVRAYLDGECDSAGDNPAPLSGWIAFDELDTTEGGRIAARFFLQFTGENLAGTIGGSVDTAELFWPPDL